MCVCFNILEYEYEYYIINKVKYIDIFEDESIEIEEDESIMKKTNVTIETVEVVDAVSNESEGDVCMQ